MCILCICNIVYCAINTKQNILPVGQKGQILTSNGNGDISWQNLPKSINGVVELPAGDYTISSSGDYDILAIGGKGGDGGYGGNGGTGGNAIGTGSYPLTGISPTGGTRGFGGKGGYGFIIYQTVSLVAGDVLNISLGSKGNSGTNGTDGTKGEDITYGPLTSVGGTVSGGEGTSGTDGVDGSDGGNTIVSLNGGDLIYAYGGKGGKGGKGGTAGGPGRLRWDYAEGLGDYIWYIVSSKKGNGGDGGDGGDGSQGGNSGTGGKQGTSTQTSVSGTDGSTGKPGSAYSPNNSTINNGSGTNGATSWSGSHMVFGVPFSNVADLFNLATTETGRVFIAPSSQKYPL